MSKILKNDVIHDGKLLAKGTKCPKDLEKLLAEHDVLEDAPKKEKDKVE